MYRLRGRVYAGFGFDVQGCLRRRGACEWLEFIICNLVIDALYTDSKSVICATLGPADGDSENARAESSSPSTEIRRHI